MHGLPQNEASEAPENMNSFSLIDDPENSERNDGERTVTRNNDYLTETADHELENVLNDAASERVYSAVEDEILESLNTEIKNMDFVDIHKNVNIIIHRQREFSGREQELYDRAMTELKPVSRMLQKSVMNVIKQRQRGATERGLLMGSRIDHTAYFRNDGKIFTKRNRQNDEISLAVGVLVDMSGSMRRASAPVLVLVTFFIPTDNIFLKLDRHRQLAGGERIRTAQAMTLVVYDFCRSMDIPVMIYGHDTTYGNTVNLYSFAEFDSIGKLPDPI